MTKDDFVFFEFELAQITETEEGRINEISTGYIRCSGRDLSDRCFPLSLSQIRLSGTFERVSRELHGLNGSLNYPDIHRYLVSLWVDASNCIENIPECDKILQRLSDFKIKILEATKSLNDVFVDGVKLYRQQIN